MRKTRKEIEKFLDECTDNGKSLLKSHPKRENGIALGMIMANSFMQTELLMDIRETLDKINKKKWQ